MKLFISALSCSGYRVGGVLGLPPFCFSRLLPFVSDGKDGVPLFRRKRYLFWSGFHRFQFLEEFSKFQPIACRHSYRNDRQRRLSALSNLEFIPVSSNEEAGRNFASRR